MGFLRFTYEIQLNFKWVCLKNKNININYYHKFKLL